MHERHVRTLEAIATIARVTVPITIGQECIPDLARASIDGSMLLVADAKATETSGCEATRRRLTRYFRALRPILDRGVLVRVAICHSEPSRAKEWENVLLGLSRQTNIATFSHPSTTDLDAFTSLTWVDLTSVIRH